jgi:hypothetical protein
MQRSHRVRWLRGAAAVIVSLVPLGACSSNDEGSTVSGGRSGNGGAGAAGAAGVIGNSGAAGAGAAGASGAGAAGASGATGASGNAGSSSGGASGSGNVPACRGLPVADDGGGGSGPADSGVDGSDSGGGSGGSGGSAGACTGASQEVERIDVDLLFLMDRSISMGERIPSGQTRWDALRAAVERLAQAPEAANLQAGINFYSISGAANDAVDCNAASYAMPAVGIGPLSMTGANMVSAIQSRSPGGLTPILPAMEGAITYARGWAQAHPDRAAAIVLVSDSYPTQCSSDPTAVAAAATAAYSGSPSIRTFIIGVGANTGARFNLENFARSGGTKTPFLVEDGDLTQTFVDTILNIAASNLACDFSIPAPPNNMVLDPARVQVIYTPGSSGTPEEIPKVNNSGACGSSVNGGYYYDNPTRPTRIYVCPCTCSRFGAGRVDVRFGCRPQIG